MSAETPVRWWELLPEARTRDLLHLHPDFSLPNGNFVQNRPWNTPEDGKPTIKAVFTFDDAKLLDQCPFVAKIGHDLKGIQPYFGVAYAKVQDLDQLLEWVKRFPDARLFTYEGEFVGKIN